MLGGQTSCAQSIEALGIFQSVGGLIGDVLVIVGVALILRRLPARAR